MSVMTIKREYQTAVSYRLKGTSRGNNAETAGCAEPGNRQQALVNIDMSVCLSLSAFPSKKPFFYSKVAFKSP